MLCKLTAVATSRTTHSPVQAADGVRKPTTAASNASLFQPRFLGPNGPSIRHINTGHNSIKRMFTGNMHLHWMSVFSLNTNSQNVRFQGVYYVQVYKTLVFSWIQLHEVNVCRPNKTSLSTSSQAEHIFTKPTFLQLTLQFVFIPLSQLAAH
jgi:hypothetical protein